MSESSQPDPQLQHRQETFSQMREWFEEARNYTNLVMVGGYAGAFAVWSFVHDTLTRQGAAAVAILLSVSVLSFAFFEVTKAVSAALVVRKYAQAIEDEASDQYSARTQLFFAEARRVTIVTGKFWFPSVVTSIVTACLAFAVLFTEAVIVLLTG